MDVTTGTIIVLAILALVAIAAFAVYRRRADVSIKGPWGTQLDVKGSNEEEHSPKGATVEDAVSRQGSLTVKDRTGQQAGARRVDVRGDIDVTAEMPEQVAVPDDRDAPAGSDQRRATVKDASAGGDVTVVTGDYTHIVHSYQAAAGRPAPDENALAGAIRRYLIWVEDQYGSLDLRGLKPREQGPSLTLDDVYVSLAARVTPDRKEAQRRPPKGEEEDQVKILDMSELLALSPRLVITGGPGSGKTTYLRLIAATLARALLTGDVSEVEARLGLEGDLPLPIFIPLSAYNNYRRQLGHGADPRQGTLVAFISYWLIQSHAVFGLPDDFFEQLLVRGRDCLLLLDGLDEVANERERLLVRRAVEELASNDGIRQMLVTSRTRAYRGEAVLRPPFRAAEVQPMAPEQVQALVRCWCAAVYEGSDPEEQADELLRAINGLERLRAARGEPRLIDTPLLATIVAIVHYDERRLPEQRADLYAKCVDVLLAERHKPTAEETFELADWGGSPTEKRGWLAYLAYKMMSAGEEAGREVKEGRLKAWLRPLIARRKGEEEADAQLDAFVSAMRQRGSLLDERGGVYAFTHLTFQEFLCAYYLAEKVREAGKIAAFLVEEGRVAQAWWRETALLVAGYLGLNIEDPALSLLNALARAGAGGEVALAAAEIAGTAFLELESHDTATRETIVQRLVSLLTDPDVDAAPPTRALAGDALARLGDPRPGVGVQVLDSGLRLPDLELCYVPPGPFWMGSPDDDPHARDREKPLHRVDVPYGYWIGRYPVTAGQFRAFLEQSGYEMQGLRERLERDPVTRPARYVTWNDALAFCRWLTEQERDAGLLPEGLAVILPSEAEWEKAARGGLEIPSEPHVARLGDDLADLSQGPLLLEENPLPQRRYPAGNGLRPDDANTREAGVEDASGAGVFPRDRSPYGVLDLAGNVNEWTRSLWGKEWDLEYAYPYDAEDGREELESEGTRVVRGGAYNDAVEDWPRCAARHGDSPYYGNVNFGFRVAVSPFHL